MQSTQPVKENSGLDGSENDGINVVLLGGALLIILAVAFAVLLGRRLLGRSKNAEKTSHEASYNKASMTFARKRYWGRGEK